MIESAMEIMDGITEYQGDIRNEFVSIANVMLDHFISTVRVYLDGSDVRTWQQGNESFEFGDMLIGPFEFEM